MHNTMYLCIYVGMNVCTTSKYAYDIIESSPHVMWRS